MADEETPQVEDKHAPSLVADDEVQDQTIFGKVAATIDRFFSVKFARVGLTVGTRPFASLGLSGVVLILCVAGFSQFNSESRSDKLWIPQNTRAQQDAEDYTKHWRSDSRFESLLLEAKDGASTALDKKFLQDAMRLHEGIENLTFEGETLASLCVPRPSDGHRCFINSVLGAWAYDSANLANDTDPLATLNRQGMSSDDLLRLLGGATFDANDKLTGAKVLTISYILQLNRVLDGGGYTDKNGEGWEEELLKFLKCDAPVCSGGSTGRCACGYDSSSFSVYAQTTRSFSDEFGSVIRGDIGLINGAFMIMIIYLILNLGGLCHKVDSRSLLAFGCVLSIVAAAAAGYGIAMWLQFDYTPVHSVLPFVIIGIGVDDSFVIMNAFDRTPAAKPVAERIALALSHAGVSIMVTSVTDFVAFAISVSSALPALSAFCMYAAFAVLMLFVFQITMFTAMATLDARRVEANRIDCCFCLPRGCPCCPTAPRSEAVAALDDGAVDPNQMLCCKKARHPGGRIGNFLEAFFAPFLVRMPVAIVVIFVFVAFCCVCIWQMLELSVEDTQRKFLPDDSYVLSTVQKNDQYFGNLGTSFDVMTIAGDYFSAQTALADLGPRLGKLNSLLPTTGDAFSSWAAAFKAACASGSVVATLDANGNVANAAEYYSRLKTWLAGAGGRFARDVVWVDDADAQRGIQATKVSAELKTVNKQVDGLVLPDAKHAVEAMEEIREACDGWTDLPGGKAVPYSRIFLNWETFKIIYREMFVSVGLCLLAVLIITTVLIAHPITALLVFLCVLMTIIDILGCMNMWGLAVDSVSVIQLVISVGLSVDYAAHVGHNFMTQWGTRAERVTKTLGDVGAAVLCGGISTFLGVMLLAFSKSYVFRVLFQTFFLTVILGLAHGLVLLPALLMILGPASYTGKRNSKLDKE
eukprot:TRINITY_DN37265_c0_g1_i1.p1 TRINITY_DN37265_c0_g1~~TRINITY_DN37265_c0_g1_i1.p1  ORF type:complete len:923 (+),score=153.03 TRINITY_DN37265_c0_g1_i1:113-2881(+)